MKFGPIPVGEAAGAIAAHSIRAGEVAIRKGKALDDAVLAQLRAAGIESVVAVRLEEGDVGEDDAALRLARALAGEGVRVEPPFTGRSNLFAEHHGLLVVERSRIDAVNAVDESVTVATLPAYKPVVAGEMVGTVKIIPYAVPATVLATVVAGEGRGVAVAPYRLRRIAAVSTLAPGLKPKVVAKTIETLANRLAPSGAAVVGASQVPHETDALTRELRRLADSDAEMVVVFGASAIADRRDVIPAALEAAGGSVEHFGMPVDPGNLLLVGTLGQRPFLGAPGCARSPKENGFDWVLQRLLAGIPVKRADITAMGVGGLLMEIVSRGQPRGGGRSAADE